MKMLRPPLVAFLLAALLAMDAPADEMHVKDGGTWREVQEIHVKDGGVWRDVQEGWVRESGVWQQFFNASYLFDPGNQNYNNSSAFPTDVINGLRIATDGDVDERDDGSYTDRDDWLLAGGTASEHEIQVTNVGDSLAAGSDSLSTWLPLSSSREWWLDTASGGAQQNCTLTVTIRHATNTSDSISFTVTLYVEEVI